MARWRWHFAAFFVYSAEAWLFLGHGASLTKNILGSGSDPTLIMWFLSYWPWAFTHHVASLHTHLMWQPVGLNLAWTTCVPLLALLALPITLLGGPVRAFNLLTLAAPVLAALAAYLLCLELFEVPVAALIGGWLFGFSSYEGAQSFDHLNLDFTVLIPLVLLVVLRRVGGKMRRPATVFWLGVLLAGEFLISDEILATLAMFGGLAFLLGYWMLPERRAGLSALAVDVALAAPVALLLSAPILYAMLTGPYDVAHPAKWSYLFSTDLLNFFVPTPGAAFGGALFAPITQSFSGGLDEQAGYLGLPATVLLIVAARVFWQNRIYRLLFVMLGIVLVASLGPELLVAGHKTGIILPWALLLHLPLLGAALPARCMLYASLIAAIIVAGWVAANARRPRLIAATFVCVSLMPVAHPVSKAPVSAFFEPGRVQAVLGQNPRLLILPFGIAGPSSYWQAENGFGFSQVGGYLGFPPVEMQAYPAVPQLFSNTFLPGFTADFVKFCRQTGVQYVIAGPGTVPGEWATLQALDWRAQKIDDVTVFTVPPHG
ncbi:MAG TPA: hypothetical protein VMV54_04750 [Acidocella sp.]|nr:hypothetical protein [Acidocella sp.]